MSDHSATSSAAYVACELFVHVAALIVLSAAIWAWVYAEQHVAAARKNLLEVARLVNGRLHRPWLASPMRLLVEGRYQGRAVRVSVINRAFGGSDYYGEVEVSLVPTRIAANLAVQKPRQLGFFQPLKHTRLHQNRMWYDPWAVDEDTIVTMERIYQGTVTEEDWTVVLARLTRAAEIVERSTVLTETPPDTWE